MSHHRDPNRHLVAYWSKREHDIMFDGPCSPDRRLLYHALCCVLVHNGRSLVDELKERGYEIDTIRFSLRRNRGCNEPDPREQKP